MGEHGVSQHRARRLDRSLMLQTIEKQDRRENLKGARDQAAGLIMLLIIILFCIACVIPSTNKPALYQSNDLIPAHK